MPTTFPLPNLYLHCSNSICSHPTISKGEDLPPQRGSKLQDLAPNPPFILRCSCKRPYSPVHVPQSIILNTDPVHRPDHRSPTTGPWPQDPDHRTLTTGPRPQDPDHRTLTTGPRPQELTTGPRSQTLISETLVMDWNHRPRREFYKKKIHFKKKIFFFFF